MLVERATPGHCGLRCKLTICPARTADAGRRQEERTVPNPDLVSLWEAHCRHEFETRDVDATMATMVADPTSTTSRP